MFRSKILVVTRTMSDANRLNEAIRLLNEAAELITRQQTVNHDTDRLNKFAYLYLNITVIII